MLRHRLILLIIAVLLVVGSLSGTIVYAVHLRSDGYRLRMQRDLSARLDLPLHVGRVRPLSFSSSRFDDIKTWLPRRKTQVFGCKRAIWREIRRTEGTDYALELRDGWLLTGTGVWTREEYDSLLQSGLGHDFAALRLREVHLADIDLRWEHRDFRLAVRDANGVIAFDEEGVGRAALDSHSLNGHPTDEPIHIRAAFEPGRGLRFHEVVLSVPRIPLPALQLDGLLGREISEGTFTGRVHYRQRSDDTEQVVLSGDMAEASLSELTNRVIGGPFRGRVTVSLDEVRFLDGQLHGLRFRGWLDDVRLGDLVPALDVPGLPGGLCLEVGHCAYEAGRIQQLNASGHADELPLDAVTRLLGYGQITGTLLVRINSLVVMEDRIRNADVDLIATPPPNRPGTIDKQLIATLLQELLGVDTSRFLPDQVEYTKLGAKLLLTGDELTVRGTHGDDGKTILTIVVAGREWGVIRQPERTFPVGDLMAALRGQVDQYDYESLETWWSRQHESGDVE